MLEGGGQALITATDIDHVPAIEATALAIDAGVATAVGGAA
jgi:hypothetical protein